MSAKNIELPLFGSITLENANWEYKYKSSLWGYEFNGNPVDLSVNFIEVTEDNVKKVSKALNSLKELNKIGIESFERDFEEAGETKSYIEEWNNDILQQVFSEEEFEEFIKNTDSEKSIEERLLSKLRLVQLSIYAESEDSFVTMDYAFGYEMDRGFRDDMLVVKLNQDYEVCEITNEG
jgi:hypothetical protein